MSGWFVSISTNGLDNCVTLPCNVFTSDVLRVINSFKELYNFGLKLLAANLINTLFKDAFLVVIGKIYSTKDLGYYKQAEQFNAILSNNFSQIVRKVTLPALSQIQDEKERLKVTYRRLFVSVAIVSFAAVFVFAFLIIKTLMLMKHQ